ncbi:MAG: hypothetical protein AB8G26_12285 [Ilumatobacter sp.]
MSAVVSVTRRSLWLILVVAGAGSLFAWWRDRTDRDLAPAEWPPLSAPTPPSTGTAPVKAVDDVADDSDVETPAAAKLTDAAADDAPERSDVEAPDDTESTAPAGHRDIAEHAEAGEQVADTTIDPDPDPAIDEIVDQPASLVNALVDAPEARSVDGNAGGWVLPDDDGTCPITHPIKANDNSGIFHVPDGRFYDRTKAERCYTTSEAASADGYRRAKH